VTRIQYFPKDTIGRKADLIPDCTAW
jgi:hypothetical protein